MARKAKKPALRGRDDESAPACQDPKCGRRYFVVVAIPQPDGGVFHLCMRCWLDGVQRLAPTTEASVP